MKAYPTGYPNFALKTENFFVSKISERRPGGGVASTSEGLSSILFEARKKNLERNWMSVLEEVVAGRLGVSRKELREWRKKIPRGELWIRVPEGIVWTARGVQMLETEYARDGALDGNEAVGVKERNKQAPRSKSEGTKHKQRITLAPETLIKNGPLKKVLRVAKVSPINRHLLLCEDQNGKAQRVRVRSNKYFVPRQLIPCIHQSGNLWTLDGKCPRARGRIYKMAK